MSTTEAKIRKENQRQLVQVYITRKEFLELPMDLRRKILRRQTDDLSKATKLQEFQDSLDVEEDP